MLIDVKTSLAAVVQSMLLPQIYPESNIHGANMGTI